MRRHALTVFLTIVALLILVPVAILMRGQMQVPWHSAPTEERSWARGDWDRKLTPTAETPPPINLDFPEPVVTEANLPDDPYLSVEWRGVPQDNFKATPTVHTTDVTEDASVYLDPDRTQAVHFSAYASRIPVPEDVSQKEFPVAKETFRDPATGAPLDEESLNGGWYVQGREWSPQSNRADYPRLIFSLTEHGIPDPRWFGVSLFDSRTRNAISNSTHWLHTRKGFHGGCLHQTWHPSPVTLTVDFFHGPMVHREIAAEIGQVADFGDFQMKLIFIQEGTSAGSSTGHTNGTTRLSFRFHESQPDEKTGAVSVNYILLCSPEWFAGTCDFAVTDEWGNELTADASGTHHSPFQVRANHRPGAGRKLRISHRPHYRRAVFQLPPVTGLPPENDGIENLFDTAIPFVRVEDENGMRQLIEAVTQFQITDGGNRASFPAGHFPIEYRATTAAELVREYRAHLPRPGDFEVRELDHTIDASRSITWRQKLENTVDRFLAIFR